MMIATGSVSQSSSIPGSSVSSSKQITTLRRASYVHVADLGKHLDIDETKLKEELSLIKEEYNPDNILNSPASHTTKYSSESSSGGGNFATKKPLASKLHSSSVGGYNLCVLVGNVDVVVDKLRLDKTRRRLAEVQIGDETGCVYFRARDEQIDLLQEVSDQKGAVVLRNCTMELFQGKYLRLAVSKWGKINTYPDDVPSTPPPPLSMNLDINLSAVDLNFVIRHFDETMSNDSAPYPTPKHDSHDTSNVKSSRFSTHAKYGRGIHDKRNRRYSFNSTGSSQYSAGRRGMTQHRNPNYSNIPVNINPNIIPGVPPPYHPMYLNYLQQHNPYLMNMNNQYIRKHHEELMLLQQYEMHQRQIQHIQLLQQQQQQHHLIPGQSYENTLRPTTPDNFLNISSINMNHPEDKSVVSPGGNPRQVIENNRQEQDDSLTTLPPQGKVDDSNVQQTPPYGSNSKPHVIDNISADVMRLHMSPGMNPQARSFAPSYLSSSVLPHSPHHFYSPQLAQQTQRNLPFGPLPYTPIISSSSYTKEPMDNHAHTTHSDPQDTTQNKKATDITP